MLTDIEIKKIRSLSKIISNPRARETSKAQHKERNYEAEAADGSKFKIFTRQSSLLKNSFSCGIMYQQPDKTWITLGRYNGLDHKHLNPLEKTSFDHQYHIHIATERYISASRKAEHYAEPTDRYSDLQGALCCLLEDWNVKGLKNKNESTGDLFQ